MKDLNSSFDKDQCKPTYQGTSFSKEFKGKNLHSSAESSMDPENERGCCSESSRKTLLGLLIVVLLAVSWVGSQQFAQSAVLSPNFDAPFFTTWFGTCWMTLCFPVYTLIAFIFKSPANFREAMSESLRIFGPESIKFLHIFTKVFPFNVLWIAVNYLYVFALTYIAATDASAISASNVAFVYAFSFVLLGELLYTTRILASLLCISGVVLFGYADGFVGGSNFVPGIVMALSSAIGAAVYKVVFKRVIGEGRLNQVSLFLSFLGLTNAIILWIVFLILYFTGVEHMVAADIPWKYLCGSASLSLVFNFLVNFGIAFTYPLFISISMMLGIPLNAAVDMVIRGEEFSALRLVAAVLVVAGFCLMMFPDSWNLPLHRRCCIRFSRCYGHESQDNFIVDDVDYKDDANHEPTGRDEDQLMG